MELLYIARGKRTPDLCNNVDWEVNACFKDDEGHHTEKSMCCHESQCTPAQREPPFDEKWNSSPAASASERIDITPLRYGKKNVCCSEELETSFTHLDENVNLEFIDSSVSLGDGQNSEQCQDSHRASQPEGAHDPSIMSDDVTVSDASGTSVDYGFISAVTFLVTGILLVIVAYIVPRDVKVDPNSIPAREMERLEKENARVGGHLDRCVIAGLCFLTLGGVVLSILLMVSMWKGEMYRRRRFAASKDSAKMYGSFSFRMKSATQESALESTLVDADALAVES